MSGASVEDVAHALVMATASTRFANLNYWVDVKTGFDYLVQIQIPPLRMDKPEDIETLPLESVNPLVNLLVRDVAKVHKGVRPGELDRDMSQRYLTLVANVEGEDMGRASRQVAQAIADAGEPPRGVRVEPMGQLPPMIEMFKALGIGLAVAVFVIFVLLTAYFQSPRLALISIGAVPGVLAGIASILYFTHTSLNIESFMGSIMSLGVSVSNSVMLVTFMDEHWKGGASSTKAAILGAGDRLRPILMTACAMTVGMVPMALALERGSQMQAPLGLAVIGGLVMSTFATLLVLPSIFAVVIGRRAYRSPSIYPDDRESVHYDPMVFADEVDEGDHGEPTPTTWSDGTPSTSCSGSSGASSMRSDRNDMIWSHITLSMIFSAPWASPRNGCTTRTVSPGRRPGLGSGPRQVPERPSLTRRFLMYHGHIARKPWSGFELGKPLGRLHPMHRPLIWRSLMRHVPWSLIPVRSSGFRLLAFGLLAALVASRLRARGKVPLHERVSKPPTVRIDSARVPEDRPGRRPAQLHRGFRAHVDLSQVDRLYREVDRRHRRQGEEG